MTIQAIPLYDDPPLSAYNVRAATHVKLGNLSDALKDTGRMVRKFESHPTVCFPPFWQGENLLTPAGLPTNGPDLEDARQTG